MHISITKCDSFEKLSKDAESSASDVEEKSVHTRRIQMSGA